jgi:hypothetical protein
MNARTSGPRFAALVLPALALLSLLSACSRVGGPRVTQSRTVEPFTSVELRGSGQLDVLIGEAPTLVIESDEESLRELSTNVRDGRLVIETQSSFWMRGGEYHIRLTTPQLESLALNGATRASIHGFAGGRTSLILSGAGDLEASGTVDRVVAQVNGAGSLDLGKLESTDAEVVVNGTGNIKVRATGRLDATVNGVGNIEYFGKPRDLNTAIHGVGSIEPR